MNGKEKNSQKKQSKRLQTVNDIYISNGNLIVFNYAIPCSGCPNGAEKVTGKGAEENIFPVQSVVDYFIGNPRFEAFIINKSGTDSGKGGLIYLLNLLGNFYATPGYPREWFRDKGLRYYIDQVVRQAMRKELNQMTSID